MTSEEPVAGMQKADALLLLAKRLSAGAQSYEELRVLPVLETYLPDMLGDEEAWVLRLMLTDPFLRSSWRAQPKPLRELAREIAERDTNPFAWKYLKELIDAQRGQVDLDEAEGFKSSNRASACPKCGRPSRELTWVMYSSPGYTWAALAGDAGWISVCERCQIRVDYFMTRMN